MSNDYTAKSMRRLGFPECVRKRPGMYIGGTGPSGLHHLAYEILDNAVDEVLAGECSEIKVSINEDGSLSVEDNGRGIPVDTVESLGKSALEAVFTELHFGGKFGETEETL